MNGVFNGVRGDDVPTAGADSGSQQPVDLVWGVKIPLRDGVELDATLYRPRGAKEQLPVVFTLTPYVADSYFERAIYFARNGYIFALVDVRGRGNSGGVFEPLANEGNDGHDVVEWFARQDWCNGKVAMWGGSYAGYDQWAAAKNFPPHLTTIVPAASCYPGVDFPFLHNILIPYMMQWMTFTSGAASNAQLFGSAEFWISKFTELYLKHMPFKDLDKLTGNAATTFQTMIAHPINDDYWRAMTPSAEDYSRISIPILTITGHYDADQVGAMTYYRMHMQFANKGAKESHFLIIGPWDHPGTRTPKRDVGGLTFGEASILDLNRLHKEWYDWTMKSGPRPEFLKKRVAYYLAGAEVWKYADDLNMISNETRLLYLSSSDGRANDAFHSGSLAAGAPKQETPDNFVYDPLDTRPAEPYQKEIKNFITDQTSALNLFGNGVVYHSEPLVASMEVTGQVRLVVWISIDVPDTDFVVELDEIKPDGTSVLLTTDSLRARYRDSVEHESLVPPGEIVKYTFDGFTFFSRRIAKGSRLRLVLNCSNSIFMEKNYNGGGVVAEESAENARTAHVTVYHDAAHQSVLSIPVVN